MRIDDNSYYIRYFINPDGVERASLVHYIEVWDDGYVIDDYSFGDESFGYEDACWNGVNTEDDGHAGTRILKRYYDRWVKRVDDCKLKIERMANDYSSPYGKMWKDGDYLYFPLKEIFAEEDAKEKEEYPEEYVEKENKYKGPEFCLVHITNADPEAPQGYKVNVGEYRMHYDNYDEEPSSLEWYLGYIDKSRIISKEVFDKAKELIRKEATEIMKDIKKNVSRIEMV